MTSLRTIAAVRRWRARHSGKCVFVPTMGALHEGHAELVREARRLAGKSGSVVVSIFVNPTQFGPKEDFSKYPRTEAADRRLCAANGADAVFLPAADEMYCEDRSVWVDESQLSSVLCGQSRPGHFRGVCTVVAKLFLIVQPSHAVFGEKDWQQLAIIRRMVRDLCFPVEIIGVPTFRESDGLAMSSRNTYLSSDDRALAPRIHEALQHAVATRKSAAAIESAARSAIEKIPGTRVDYVAAVDAETLAPWSDRSRAGRLASAVFLGTTRLIDNIPIPQQSP